MLVLPPSFSHFITSVLGPLLSVISDLFLQFILEV